jgi:hypothetical protein
MIDAEIPWKNEHCWRRDFYFIWLHRWKGKRVILGMIVQSRVGNCNVMDNNNNGESRHSR